jgi:hypothetical protein
MSAKHAFVAASASIIAFSVVGVVSARAQALAPQPTGPLAIGTTDFYSGLQAFGSFEDFGAFNDYNRGRNTSVMQRERPEYAALGVPLSGFILYPRLASGVGYTDNVLASEINKVSDEWEEFAPNIIAQSTWSRNSLNLDLGGDFKLYDHKSGENEDGGHIRALSRIDLVGDSYGLLGADVQRAYEPRTDGGFPVNAATSVPFTTYGAFGRGVYQQSRVRGSVSVDFRALNWDSIKTTTGSYASQKFRDEDVVTVAGRGEFASTPDTGVFGEVAYVNSSYLTVVGLPNRNSDEYRALIGTDFDLTALVRGEIGGGYVQRQYASALYGTLSGFSGRGQVEYFPTPLTTLTLNFSRSIQDATIINSGGYFSNLVGLKADHELLRNLLINAALTYEYDTYNGIARHDAIGNFRLGFQYLLSRGVGINATYSYAKRESRSNPIADGGPQFNTNRLYIGLVLQR